MPVDMRQLSDDLLAETAWLTGLLAALPEEGWSMATPAPGWRVLDQVTHLAYFDEQAAMAATDPDRFCRERATALADVDGFTAAVADRHRGLSGADALAWLDRARTAMVGAMVTLDPATRVPWYGPDMSLASSLTARIMETWAHVQDVADAVGSNHPAGPALRHVVHIGARAFANSFMAHGLAVPQEGVRVEVSAPDGNTWAWGPPDAENRVTGSAVDFALVVTQRRHRRDSDLVATGAVADSWLEVAQAFAGPPGAKRQAGQFEVRR